MIEIKTTAHLISDISSFIFFRKFSKLKIKFKLLGKIVCNVGKISHYLIKIKKNLEIIKTKNFLV